MQGRKSQPATVCLVVIHPEVQIPRSSLDMDCTYLHLTLDMDRYGHKCLTQDVHLTHAVSQCGCDDHPIGLSYNFPNKVAMTCGIPHFQTSAFSTMHPLLTWCHCCQVSIRVRYADAVPARRNWEQDTKHSTTDCSAAGCSDIVQTPTKDTKATKYLPGGSTLVKKNFKSLLTLVLGEEKSSRYITVMRRFAHLFWLSLFVL